MLSVGESNRLAMFCIGLFDLYCELQPSEKIWRSVKSGFEKERWMMVLLMNLQTAAASCFKSLEIKMIESRTSSVPIL